RASLCLKKKKKKKSLSLESRLEMMKLSKEGMSKAKTRQKLDLLPQTVSQAVNAKGNAPVNTQMIRKRNSLIADVEKVWSGEKNQTSLTIPLGQSLTQYKAIALVSFVKTERVEEAAEELEASRDWFVRFKERCRPRNIKVQGKAAGADGETVSYSEDLAGNSDEGGYTQEIISVGETAFYGKKMPSRTFLATEKSVSGFKASKGRLTLLLGANGAGDFKLKPTVIYHAENLRALKNDARSTLPVFCKWNGKASVRAHLFTACFTEYFKPTFETCSSEKKPFKILPLMDNVPRHARALMGIYKEVNVGFMPARPISVLQPMDQGRITVKSHYLRTIFHKTVVVMDDNSSDGFGQSQWKTFWKGFIILNAIKNVCDSWEEVRVSTLTGVGKKLIPTLVDLQGFNASMEEVAADVVEIAREVELDVEPEDSELPQSHNQTCPDEDLLLRDEQSNSCGMASTLGKDAVDIVEMTTRTSNICMNLAGKAVAGFERIDCNFERSSTVGKMLSNSIACYREVFHERTSPLTRQASLLSHLKKLPQSPQPLAPTTLISPQPSTSKQDPPPA
uniref:HTH CENPB-type domain-containing protein n=1 Tax=Chlorocebus sabaeus TaxID=60711 RepID=A0A0D9RYG5_CHLSB